MFTGEIGKYIWNVTEAFSPTYMDPMCIPNFYYSDINQNIDPNSGTQNGTSILVWSLEKPSYAGLG